MLHLCEVVVINLLALVEAVMVLSFFKEIFRLNRNQSDIILFLLYMLFFSMDFCYVLKSV